MLTRPTDDSTPLSALLTACGASVLVDPMLTIIVKNAPEMNEDSVQGVLFTSANGVRAYSRASSRRDLPAFTVGERTADAARSAGFSNVRSANGDVESLAALVQETAHPEDGDFLHPAGSAVAGDLAGLLADSGYTLRRVVLYESKRSQQLSDATLSALRNGRLDMILFYSPRTAATFTELAAALKNACAKVDILCLSQAVADAARDIQWRRIFVAPNPTQADMLAILDERLDGS